MEIKDAEIKGEQLKSKTTSPQLPKYNEGMAAALLAAREAVMSPIRPILREYSLSEQQWRLLRVLIDHGPMEISKVAEASMIMGPSVTRILKDLGGRKLITRNTDPTDARRSILAITPAGRALVRKTAKQTASILSDYKQHFGEKRFGELIDELNAFQQTIKTTNIR